MHQEDPSFFGRLTFDPALKRSFIARYFSNIRVIVLVVLTLTGAGLATYFNLPRELNPNIQIPIVFVTTVFPGAGSEDVESLITIPLEDALEGVADVDTVTSASKENISSITVTFLSGTDPTEAKNDVQNAIDEVTDLPLEAESPKIQVLDFQNQPVLTFALSNRENTASLGVFADHLKEEIKAVSGVQKVELSYRQDPTIEVVLDPQTLLDRKLSPFSIADTIRSALEHYPSGNLATDTTSFGMSSERLAHSVAQLRMLPITVDESVLPLNEIASVEEREEYNTARAFLAYPTTPPIRSIIFSVFKTDGADTGKTVALIMDAQKRLAAPYGDQYLFEPMFDGAKEIKKSFDQLFKDFLLTIGLVFIILFTFFGLRQSVIASLAIPLTFLGTFLVMQATDISINFIALFSLLLALGILVDNAIVIISAMANYDRTKKFSPSEVALLVWRDFRMVIVTTTITTVWAFLPLLLATGIIGEFIRPIPIVVSSALAISAVIALLIVIPLMATLMTGHFAHRVLIAFKLLLYGGALAILIILIPEGSFRFMLITLAALLLIPLFLVFRSFLVEFDRYEETHFTRFAAFFHRLAGQGLFNFEPLSHRYERYIRNIISSQRSRRMTLVFLIIFSLSSYALVPLGYVVNEFFPSDDQDVIYASLVLPTGTSLERSQSTLVQLLDELRTRPHTRAVIGEVGATPPTDNNQVGGREPNYLLATILLTPAKERTITSGEMVALLNQDYETDVRGKFSATQISGGPPAGSDLQLSILGSDLSQLKDYAEKTAQYLREIPYITNVNISIESGTSKVVFIPDAAAMVDAAVSNETLAFYLRTLGSSLKVKSDSRFGEEKRDVIIRFSADRNLADPDLVGLLTIPSSKGPLPLSSLGRFVLQPNPTLITREDGRRTIAISASVEEGYSVSKENADLEQFADDVLNLSEGYTWKTGGVNEENNKSVQSILQAMLLSALLIFGTMAIQFHSFRKAAIVLLVIPLAVSGVFIVFALFGIPLSFPSLIGILALFGIVVNNSIIMVDKINKNMDSGLPLHHAVSEGAASRLEPILLTALTTIVGLIPITLSDPIWQGLGGAIIAGLTFSGIAKLLFIPVIYALWFKDYESDTKRGSAEPILPTHTTSSSALVTPR